MELKDKVAIITGGSRGIGKAITSAFLKEGANVMLAARTLRELEAAKKELKGLPGKVEICETDVSREKDIEGLVQKTEALFGEINILVNAAGIYGPIGPSESVDFDEWKKTYEINVFGVFRMMQRVLPIMVRNKKGKIINFSGGGDGPLPRFSAYNSSKVAVVRLTETIAAEVRELGIDINALSPGPVNTRFLDEALAAGEEKVGRERYQELLKQKEQGGVSVEKTAAICVFLASSQSDGLSGKLLSAIWDDWRSWDKNKIAEIMKSNAFALRRVTL